MRSLTRLTVCALLMVLAVGGISLPVHAATGTIAPFPKHQFFDANGDPCNGCLLFTYTAGTSTKVSTYTEVTLSSANTNPIVLDSAGRATIFLTPGVSYKFVLSPSTDSDPPVAPLWTIDNVSAVPPASTSADVDVTAVAGETLAAGDAVYLSDGSGGQTVGRWYKADADNTYSSTAAQAVGFANAALSTGATGTVRRIGRVTGLTSLVAGTDYFISATAGAVTATGPTQARVIGRADSTTSLIIVPGSPYASSTVQGVVSIAAQTFLGIKTFTNAPVLSAGATFASTNTLGNMIVACSSSDFTKNANTTLGDVTGIAFAVEASSNYLFLFLLHGRTTAAADWKFTLTGPSAPTAVRFGEVPGQENAASDANAFTTVIADGGTDGVDKSYIISGRLRNGSNAGTVQLQAAQKTSDATDSKIYAESCVIALKIS